MKIQCDVCVREQATVFCPADEATLCHGCDHKVHHANKLAQKHRRFSLLHTSRKDSAPLCDICQEKRAFMFCREDRAILCRECDVSIHQAKEQVHNHSRFLLTGVKLSASLSTYPLSSSPPSSCEDSNSRHKVRNSKSKTRCRANNSSSDHHQVLQGSESSSVTNSTSYISEYLETLPGWDVEAFFDPSPDYYAFC